MNYYIQKVNTRKFLKTTLLFIMFTLNFNAMAAAADQEGPPDWPKHPSPQPPHR